MSINNPYTYHPHPLIKAEADDICLLIEKNAAWNLEFDKGKMLGILLCKAPAQPFVKEAESLHLKNGYGFLVAYSGIVNIADPDHFFVPPVYDLNNPGNFYLQEDEAISALNKEIADMNCNDARLATLKQQRKELSLQLQLKIFRHFNFTNTQGIYKNIVDIFGEAKRGLPPGGTGECAAPRLLQYALSNGLTPIAIAEFWYGQSPKQTKRVHKQFYPSCIEKCSPIVAYMTEIENPDNRPTLSKGVPELVFESDKLIVLNKPGGLLSSPAKDGVQPNVEDWLKTRYPECRLPNLLAHRLDQSTKGLLMAALDAETHKWLQQGFEQRKIKKRYLAWLEGDVKSQCGIINLPICPNPDDRPRQTVDWQFGKTAITKYKVIRKTETAEGTRTLVEFHPLTGRTHQLRLHAVSAYGLDCPIVGDSLYGATSNKELKLFAQKIKLPDGRIFIADGEEEFCGEYV